MPKHRLILIIASLLAMAALSACGNADANEASRDVNCDPDNVASSIPRLEANLEDARKDAEDAKGTPAESDANDRLREIEAWLEAYRNCGQEATTSTSTTVAAPTSVTVDPASLAGVFEGPVDPTELSFGEEAIASAEGAPQERGSNAHSRVTLRTPGDVITWFNSDDPKAQPVRDRVYLSTLAQCGEQDAAAIMAGNGWLTMVVNPRSQVLGTSYAMDSGMEFARAWRQTGEKDKYHIPVCLTGPNAGKIVPNGMVRADCGNGHDAPKIRINRPDTPPAPPVEQPPTPEEPPTPVCPPEMPYGTPPICKDSPSRDVNNNPLVPPQVRGPGTTPIGVDPGPATPPIDSPTGCQGPCPTTPTTVPSGGGGSGPSTTVPRTEGGNTGITLPPTPEPPPAPPITAAPPPGVTVPSR